MEVAPPKIRFLFDAPQPFKAHFLNNFWRPFNTAGLKAHDCPQLGSDGNSQSCSVAE